MCADAPTTVPIAPSSISLRAVWKPAPKNVSGAPPRYSPFFSASATSRRPSSAVAASGFSEYTCLPAASAARDTSKCSAGRVRFRMTSTRGSRNASSIVS